MAINALLITAATALLVGGRVSAQTAGDFSILTMNVAGLPSILQGNEIPGDKTTNSELIGTKFAELDYDLIHVQEDFNYHAYIYSTDDHPYRSATSGGVPFGSGLNSLSNFPWVDYTRIKWDTCSNTESDDCLTPKGFTFMRLQVSASTDNSTAVYVDAYNLHTDAGTTAADEVARDSNINQVLTYINTWSTGNAVMIFGDTNSRYTRVLDTAIVDLLNAGFKDAFVQLSHGGVVPTVETLCDNPQVLNETCETVDKVFYRSSALVDLEATDFNYASSLFLQADGSILSDHNPVNVNFTWSSGTALRQSGYWGGGYGSWFSDVATLEAKTSPKVSVLTFHGSARLDSVGLTLTDGTILTHGGTGGTLATLTLASGEYWKNATLCQGVHNDETRNFYILATTSTGRTLTAGTTTTDCVTFTAPSGWGIVGFIGQDGDEMDQLAFVYAPQ